MGNTPSSSDGAIKSDTAEGRQSMETGEQKDTNFRSHPDLAKRKKMEHVQPPPEWNPDTNNMAFNLISPVSDISCPSQFRHRIKPGESAHGPETNSVQKTSVQTRRRTSKVMSKEMIHTHANKVNGQASRTCLPAPVSFYFENSPRSPPSYDSKSIGSKENRRASSSTSWSRRARQKASKRVIRARRAFHSCWGERPEDAMKKPELAVSNAILSNTKQHNHRQRHVELISPVESSSPEVDFEEGEEERPFDEEISHVDNEGGLMTIEESSESPENVVQHKILPPSPHVQFDPTVPGGLQFKGEDDKKNLATFSKLPPFNPVWREDRSGTKDSITQAYQKYLHDEQEYLDRMVFDKAEPRKNSTSSNETPSEAYRVASQKSPAAKAAAIDENAIDTPVVTLFGTDEVRALPHEEKMSPYDETSPNKSSQTPFDGALLSQSNDAWAEAVVDHRGNADSPARSVTKKDDCSAAEDLEAEEDSERESDVTKRDEGDDRIEGADRKRNSSSANGGQRINNDTTLERSRSRSRQRISAERANGRGRSLGPRKESHDYTDSHESTAEQPSPRPRTERLREQYQKELARISLARNVEVNLANSVVASQQVNVCMDASETIADHSNADKVSKPDNLNETRHGAKEAELVTDFQYKVSRLSMHAREAKLPQNEPSKNQSQERLPLKPLENNIISTYDAVQKSNKQTCIPVVKLNRSFDSTSSNESENQNSPAMTTTAKILQQTYPIIAAFSKKPGKKGPWSSHLTTRSTDGSIASGSANDYRITALGIKSPVRSATQEDDSSVGSTRSMLSESSVPTLYDEAIYNAAFLFSPTYAGDAIKTTDSQGIVMQPRVNSIATFESRNRVSSFSSRSQPVTIPARSSLSIDEASTESDRKVRFSQSHEIFPFENGASHVETAIEPSTVYIPFIENKLSDLTDSVSYGTETSPRHASNIQKFASIQEEAEEEGVFDGDEGRKKNKISPNPVSRWSRASGGSMDNGVTPLRSGKSTMYATNSPYLRFKEAKNRFSKPQEAPKVPTFKKPSGTMVLSRIAQMEGRLSETQHCHVSNPVNQTHSVSNVAAEIAATALIRTIPASKSLGSRPKTPERENIDDELAYEASVVSTPDYEYDTSLADGSSKEDVFADVAQERFDHIISPENVNESETGNQDSRLRRIFRKQSAVEEASGASQLDGDVTEDEFAEFLNYQESPDEEEGSIDEDTVPTVRQDHQSNMFVSLAGMMYGSYRVSNGDDNSSSISGATRSTTIVQDRRSILSLGESSTLSSVIGKEPGLLPFRNAAPVKPNEQVPRKLTGDLDLSPTQRTPMQARKWRVLAAAALEKDNQLGKVGKKAANQSPLLNQNAYGVSKRVLGHQH